MFSRVVGRRRIRFVAPGLVLVLACAAVAAQAAKSPTISGKSQSAALPPDNDTHTVLASCSSGDKVIGGGLKNQDSLHDFFQGSYPTGGGGWTAAGFRLANQPGSAKLTSYARCLSSGKVTTRSKTATFPKANKPAGAVAKCKPNESVLGGGIKLSDAVNDYAAGTYPSGKRGWKAVGYTTGSAPTKVTSYAICAKDVQTKRVSSSKKLNDNVAVAFVEAKCPKHYSLAGGGSRPADAYNDYLSGSYPDGHSWVAQGIGADSKLTAYAICVK